VLHLIPDRLARGFYRLAHRGRIVWWGWRRPELRGCRIIALDAQDRVLLVRHSYGSGKWMPPGGGLPRHEDARDAARRELAEEVGLALTAAALLGEVVEPLHGASNRIGMVAGRSSGKLRIDGREVVEAAFFPLAALPGEMPAALRRALPAWVRAATTACPRDGGAPPRRDDRAPTA